MGQTTQYTPEIADIICERLIAGESMRRICTDDAMPAEATVYKWLQQDQEGFVEKYTRARASQAERMLDEILEIADDATNDFMTITKGDVSYEVENKEWTSRSKLRVDTRKWAMSKLAPKKYGDKLDLTSGGEKLAPQYYVLPNGTRVEF